MSEYKPVPVEAARRIAVNFDKAMVVILSYDRAFSVTHTTTYGVEAFDKENAAAAGELCTKALGGDLGKKQSFEDFHNDYTPAFFREVLELLALIHSRGGCTPVMLQQVERILKANGRGLRQG
jgi:hypothetical protein